MDCTSRRLTQGHDCLLNSWSTRTEQGTRKISRANTRYTPWSCWHLSRRRMSQRSSCCRPQSRKTQNTCLVNTGRTREHLVGLDRFQEHTARKCPICTRKQSSELPLGMMCWRCKSQQGNPALQDSTKAAKRASRLRQRAPYCEQPLDYTLGRTLLI